MSPEQKLLEFLAGPGTRWMKSTVTESSRGKAPVTIITTSARHNENVLSTHHFGRDFSSALASWAKGHTEP